MIDRLLSAGSTFDWISPLIAFIKDAANGPSHTFLIPAGSGRSGIEIERLLRSRGVQTWGLMMVNDTTMITVPKTEASWAQYLLDEHEVGVENPFAGSAHSGGGRGNAAARGRGPDRRVQGDLVDRLGQGIDDLFRL